MYGENSTFNIYGTYLQFNKPSKNKVFVEHALKSIERM